LVEEERGAAAAEPHWRRAVDCAEGAMDAGDPEIAAAQIGLASVCREVGKQEEARSLAERVLASVSTDPRECHPLPKTVRELAQLLLK
jgi:hypothetical protein